MILDGTRYEEGQFSPEPGGGHNFNVWCRTGALQVLRSKEHVQYLDENPEEAFTINFANNAYAHIDPAHPLWVEMQKTAAEYEVKVFPNDFSDRKYVPWTGGPDSRDSFEAISIRIKR